MPAPFPNPTNFTDSAQIFGYINNVTEDWFGRILILAIFVIIFIAGKEYETKKAFAASSFITFVIAVLFRAINLIDDFTMMLIFIAAAVGLIALLSETKQEV